MQKNNKREGPLAYWLRINSQHGRRGLVDAIVYYTVLSLTILAITVWVLGSCLQPTEPGRP